LAPWVTKTIHANPLPLLIFLKYCPSGHGRSPGAERSWMPPLCHKVFWGAKRFHEELLRAWRRKAGPSTPRRCASLRSGWRS